MIRRPPRSTLDRSSAASDVYKRQVFNSSLLLSTLLPALIFSFLFSIQACCSAASGVIRCSGSHSKHFFRKSMKALLPHLITDSYVLLGNFPAFFLSDKGRGRKSEVKKTSAREAF
eukprot:TRINITY_DN4138_c0_g1_i11.p2 TRINITY_DN4138_c0_g1~~TRINITY_DN4138_c0_g1_i11.p2  ORF type:complete len:124 (+),score=36.41 TRINITY_DN4138_c0_g1_i11:25-372(+)